MQCAARLGITTANFLPLKPVSVLKARKSPFDCIKTGKSSLNSLALTANVPVVVRISLKR